jgi:hypothetical protein
MNKLNTSHIEKQIELTEIEGRELMGALEKAETGLIEYKKRLNALFNSLRGIQKLLED